jgi:MFS family permease
MPNYVTFAITLVFVGLFSITFSTSANAFVQTATTPTMRGRVMSIYMAIFAGTTFVGAPIVGWIADSLGPRWALGTAALSGIAALAIGLIWFATGRRNRLTAVTGPAVPALIAHQRAIAP